MIITRRVGGKITKEKKKIRIFLPWSGGWVGKHFCWGLSTCTCPGSGGHGTTDPPSSWAGLKKKRMSVKN